MSRTRRSIILICIFVLVGCSVTDTELVTGTLSLMNPTQSAHSQITVDSLPQKTLIVFAAASLTDAFQELGKNFEKLHPGVNVQFNFTGSQIARTQIEQGARADIFASADHKNMDLLTSQNLVRGDTYQDFATNRLVVIMPRGNPASVKMLDDLARPGLKLILADESVPAGNYARQALTKMSEISEYRPDFMTKVLVNVVSNETDVKQVVTKVELGEADAGIVYVSDAIADPDLVEIAIPDQFNITASYPIAVLANASNPLLAESFVGYIMSLEGQAVMDKWGFGGAAR